jgi:hypothetical protein
MSCTWSPVWPKLLSLAPCVTVGKMEMVCRSVGERCPQTRHWCGLLSEGESALTTGEFGQRVEAEHHREGHLRAKTGEYVHIC